MWPPRVVFLLMATGTDGGPTPSPRMSDGDVCSTPSDRGRISRDADTCPSRPTGSRVRGGGQRWASSCSNQKQIAPVLRVGHLILSSFFSTMGTAQLTRESLQSILLLCDEDIHNDFTTPTTSKACVLCTVMLLFNQWIGPEQCRPDFVIKW